MATPGGGAPGRTAPEHPSGDRRFEALDAALRRHRGRPDALLEILHAAQEIFGWLASDVLVYVGRSLKLPLSRVYGVATFYNLFRLAPAGEHTCTVCLGTACYVRGAGEIFEGIRRAHGVGAGETTPDGKITLAVARCVGNCGSAPVVAFDRDYRADQSTEGVLARLREWSQP
jgi:bidirectional [NiFe] hydrogenase diaphorase subunit